MTTSDVDKDLLGALSSRTLSRNEFLDIAGITQQCWCHLFSVPVTEESVNTLRHRLNAMKGILEDEDPKSVAARKKAARKRAGN